MIDAHVHINEYGTDLPKAIDQIRQLSIKTLAVSMDIPSYKETLRISKSEPLILPSFGIHPWKAPDYADRLDELDDLIKSAPAIGEIGLDHRFVKDQNKYLAQDLIFNYQLHSAERFGKIINLHTSGAEKLVLESLQNRSLPAIVIHWYNGPMELVRDFLDLGAYFTIGVEIFDSDFIRTLASILPKDRILTETDNPNGWDWLHGRVGFPNLIKFVEWEIADIRKKPEPELSEIISSNYNALLKAGGLSDFQSGVS